MKIVTILGARPQFIKAGSVSREIAKYDGVDEVIIHTGQHYDANMSDIFFSEMQIPKPDYNLGIGGKSHGAMTGQMIEKIETIVQKEDPDWVMVYGDTNSTLSGAIVASKIHIKLAHIEAGLRSFNMNMPEEVNRILTDRVSTILFCPTDTAVNNLMREGYPNKLSNNTYQIIENSGDVMNDGAIFYKKYEKKPSEKIDDIFILCTIHRAENTDNIGRLKDIFRALNAIATSSQVVLPLHPRTKAILSREGMALSDNINIIDPVGYLEMIWLIHNCQLVMTDSGGLQKESSFFKKYCITLRDETEWTELLDNKINYLAGSNPDKIMSLYQLLKDKPFPGHGLNLYGNGNASKNIVNSLIQFNASKLEEPSSQS